MTGFEYEFDEDIENKLDEEEFLKSGYTKEQVLGLKIIEQYRRELEEEARILGRPPRDPSWTILDDRFLDYEPLIGDDD